MTNESSSSQSLRLSSHSLHGTAGRCNQTCGILYPLLFEQIQLKGKVRYKAGASQAFCPSGWYLCTACTI